MTATKEQWLIERGPVTDPEYLVLVTVGAAQWAEWLADPEAATRFDTPDQATMVATETRVEELRVVSDVDL